MGKDVPKLVRRPELSKKSLLAILIILLVSVLIFGLFLLRPDSQQSPPPEKPTTPVAAPKQPQPQIDLQPPLDKWLQNNSGTYSVVMLDANSGQTVATHDSDRQFFMASIYKLYVAYLALQDIQNRVHSADEIFLNNLTRQDCIDLMIRKSDSPCGEKYMAELTPTEIEARLQKLKLSNTDFGSLSTTTNDVSMLLKRLYSGQDLNNYYRGLLLDAMKNQIYRDTIAKGAAPYTVANKVGFRDLVEYHDVAIIYAGNNTAYILSVFTKNAGTAKIADLAKTLKNSLDS